MNTLDAQLVQRRAHLRAEWIVAPFRTLRQADGSTIWGHVARYADLDRNKVLLGRQPAELGTKLAVQCVKAGVGCSAAEICRHTVAPQLPSAKGGGSEFQAVKADAYA